MPQLSDFKGSFTGEHSTGLTLPSVTLKSMSYANKLGVSPDLPKQTPAGGV